MLVAIVLILISTAIICLIQYARNESTSPKGKPVPKHHGLPLLGMALDINESNGIYKFAELAKRHGEIFCFNVFRQNVVVLNSVSLLRKAFCSEKYGKYFNNKPKSFYGKYFRPGGDSVAFTPDGTGYTYKRMKKSYMKALHTYGSGIKDLETKILSELDNLVTKINSMETKAFIFEEVLKRSLTNVIAVILVGESLPDGHKDEDLFWQYVAIQNFFIAHYVESILSTLPLLRFMPFTKFGKMYREGKQLQKRIAERYFYSIKKTHKRGDEVGIVRFYLEQQKKEMSN
ncbi:hypothetical protein ACF0H5_007483 [Mactra antiquata]